MSLPVNLEDLINGRSIEWERLEFIQGWNPLKILHEICAFANDFSNLNGGYVVLGITDNGNGRPVLPPAGLDPDDIEQYQRELRGKCKRLDPEYHPIMVPEVYEDKHILVLWCPGGQTRPYKAPKGFSSGSDYAYFIRQGAETVEAKGQQRNELMKLAADVPFDDRMNQQYDVDELDKQLIRSYLHDINSQLYEEIDELEFNELCLQMQIADRTNSHLSPRNVGLLFFTPEPHRYFPTAQIEVVHFRDREGGDLFEEKIFQGPLHHQIQQTLSYLRNTHIEERVIKHEDRAEAERFYNYPFPALEEAVVNAVYHRSYQEREPIEIRVTPENIKVLSFPGPVRSVKMEDFEEGPVIARRYRNRRIGEFLKELDLTEGRGTGIPKIRRNMEKNGSPDPEFHTDEQRTHFLVTLPVHSDFEQETDEPEQTSHKQNTTSEKVGEKLGKGWEKVGNKLGKKGEEMNQNQKMICVEIFRNKNITIQELSNKLGISTTAIENNIRKLKERGVLSRKGGRKAGHWEINEAEKSEQKNPDK